MIAHDDLRRTVHRCVPRLLRAPIIRGSVRNGGMHDRAATQVEEEEDEDVAKPNVERLLRNRTPTSHDSAGTWTSSVRRLAFLDGPCTAEPWQDGSHQPESLRLPWPVVIFHIRPTMLPFMVN